MTMYRATLRLRGLPSFVTDYRRLDSAAVLSLRRVVSHEIREAWEQTTLTVTLRRRSHLEAANNLLALVQSCGYWLINGEISAWVSQTVAGAVIGGGSFTALGSTSEDIIVTGAAGLLGTVAGALVGSQMKRVEAIYQLRPNHAGGWTLVPVPLPSAPGAPAAA